MNTYGPFLAVVGLDRDFEIERGGGRKARRLEYVDGDGKERR